MNFRNISLFSLLFSAGFVGTVIQAEIIKVDEAALRKNSKMDSQKKLEYKMAEKEAMVALYRVYDTIRQQCTDDCDLRPQFTMPSEDEVCQYGKRMYNKLNRLNKVIDKLQNEIFEIENED